MNLECEENASTLIHDNTGSPLSQKTIPANDPHANEADTHWTQQHIDVVNGYINSCRRFSPTEMNARGPDGVTPLMIAATSTNSRKKAELEEILDVLIYNGAYLNETTDIMKESALHLAVRCGQLTAVKKLLGAGADPNMLNAQGLSPLHLAASLPSGQITQMLLRCHDTKVDIKSQTISTNGEPEEFTPLIFAVRFYKGDTEIMDILLSANALVDAIDRDGKTALHWASYDNNLAAIELLLSKGAKKDAQDAKDQTPLFLAATEGNFEACQILLAAGANKDIADKANRKSRDVADANCYWPIVQLLDVTPCPSSNSGDCNASYDGLCLRSPTGNARQEQPRKSKSFRETTGRSGKRQNPHTANKRKQSYGSAVHHQKHRNVSEKGSISNYKSPVNALETSQSFMTASSPANRLYASRGHTLGVFNATLMHEGMMTLSPHTDGQTSYATGSSRYGNGASHYSGQNSVHATFKPLASCFETASPIWTQYETQPNYMRNPQEIFQNCSPNKSNCSDQWGSHYCGTVAALGQYNHNNYYEQMHREMPFATTAAYQNDQFLPFDSI